VFRTNILLHIHLASEQRQESVHRQHLKFWHEIHGPDVTTMIIVVI
jgi:hypothetical protein